LGLNALYERRRFAAADHRAAEARREAALVEELIERSRLFGPARLRQLHLLRATVAEATEELAAIEAPGGQAGDRLRQIGVRIGPHTHHQLADGRSNLLGVHPLAQAALDVRHADRRQRGGFQALAGEIIERAANPVLQALQERRLVELRQVFPRPL